MYGPIVKILYDEQHTLTELVVSLNTEKIRDFHGELVRTTMIPDFVTEYLLLQSQNARD